MHHAGHRNFSPPAQPPFGPACAIRNPCSPDIDDAGVYAPATIVNACRVTQCVAASTLQETKNGRSHKLRAGAHGRTQGRDTMQGKQHLLPRQQPPPVPIQPRQASLVSFVVIFQYQLLSFPIQLPSQYLSSATSSLHILHQSPPTWLITPRSLIAFPPQLG